MRLLRWSRAHPWRTIGLVVLVGFFVLNLLAYRHAYAMTHFDPDGVARRERPESLSVWARARLVLGGSSLRRPTALATPANHGLTYQTHTVPGQDGLLEAWFLPCERSRGVVLLFHGYTSCKANLLPEGRAWHDLGFACLLVDFRACGGSAGDRTTLGYHEADDAARVVAWARERWPEQPVLLFGQSMGSAASLRALSRLGVEADALVLECPFDRFLSAVSSCVRALSLPAFPAAHLLVFWGGVQHGFDGFAHKPCEDARGVHCPVLLLLGDSDPRVALSEVEAVRDNLAGPSRLVLFEGVGHESYVARQPQKWKATVEGFVRTSLESAERAPD